MFAAMSDGNYISESDMKEVDEMYNDWPSYEIKATPQTV